MGQFHFDCTGRGLYDVTWCAWQKHYNKMPCGSPLWRIGHRALFYSRIGGIKSGCHDYHQYFTVAYFRTWFYALVECFLIGLGLIDIYSRNIPITERLAAMGLSDDRLGDGPAFYEVMLICNSSALGPQLIPGYKPIPKVCISACALSAEPAAYIPIQRIFSATCRWSKAFWGGIISVYAGSADCFTGRIKKNKPHLRSAGTFYKLLINKTATAIAVNLCRVGIFINFKWKRSVRLSPISTADHDYCRPGPNKTGGLPIA